MFFSIVIQKSTEGKALSKGALWMLGGCRVGLVRFPAGVLSDLGSLGDSASWGTASGGHAVT